jgi:predicted nucleic acid-binding protein
MFDSYMLDTNVFNDLLDEKILPLAFAGRLLVTAIQAAELRATPTAERRRDLLLRYEETRPISAPAASFAFDIEGAGWGQACWNDGSGNFEKMLSRLRMLDPINKSSHGQVRDILIAETAIKNAAVLVTADSNLRQVVSEFGGHALSIKDIEPE